MTTAHGPPLRRGWTSRRGALTCLAMFAVGGAVLWGLFQAPRPDPPPAAPSAPYGAPGRALRFVSHDLRGDGGATDAAADEIARLRPDFVLLQGVRAEHVLS